MTNWVTGITEDNFTVTPGSNACVHEFRLSSGFCLVRDGSRRYGLAFEVLTGARSVDREVFDLFRGSRFDRDIARAR